MASRMERYHNHSDRSTRNKDLYKNIEDLDSYSNIEGVIEIDKTNEIDITRVKEMIQGREEYKKKKQYRQIAPEEEEEVEEISSEKENDRTYDIRDVLVKAKETRIEPDEKYRKLKNVNYDIIKKLNLKGSSDEIESQTDLVGTVTLHTKTIKPDSQDDLGLLDDLKADTIVGDSGSIKKIIEEAKAEQEEKEMAASEEVSSNLENLDKSFYTSSLGFTDSDFEDLLSLGDDIKKHNGLLKVLIIILVIVALIILAFLGYQLLK